MKEDIYNSVEIPPELPAYSVVIPVHNDVRYLEDAVNSALAQTHPPSEIIIVEDASRPAARAEIESICELHSIARSIWSERQLGAGLARNMGIEAASSAYVALLDSDDIWAETKMADQLTAMRRQGATFSATQYGTIKAERVVNKPRKAYSGWVRAFNLLADNPIGTSSVVFNKSIGLRFPELKRRQDWAAWIETTNAGHACWVVGDVLVYHRVAHSSSSLSANKFACFRYQWHVLRHTAKLSLMKSAMFITTNVVLSVYHDLLVAVRLSVRPQSTAKNEAAAEKGSVRPRSAT